MRKLTPLAVAGLLAAGGIGASASGAKSAHVSRAASVTIRNFAFAPRTLTVRRGTVVTVRNRDSTNHSFSSTRGTFDLPNLAPGHSGRVRFSRSGHFTYYCRFHPYMRGTIVVR